MKISRRIGNNAVFKLEKGEGFEVYGYSEL